MFNLAGLAFLIEPESSLTKAEKAALQRLADPTPDKTPLAGVPPPPPARVTASAPAGLPPFRIVLDRCPARAPEATPIAARVSWADGLCVLDHAAFRAEIDPFRREGRVFRSDGSELGLVITLRTALAGRLPLEGGIVLHAAGLECHGQAIAFFGPSGAGKSTLAQCSSWPVLSDELVAVVPEGGAFSLRGTPFRRAPAGAAVPSCEAPKLCALVELDKGPSLDLKPIGHREALRRLIACAAVPAAPPLWSAAIGVLGRLTSEVPCYRMAWSPKELPFAHLASALGL